MIASARNRSGTIFVRADNQGIPITVRIDRSALRAGGAAVAAEVLELCRQASIEAKAAQRDLLAADGVPSDTLDRLGLPTRKQTLESLGDRDSPPDSWMTSA